LISILLFLVALTGGLVGYSQYAARSAVKAYPPLGRFETIDGVRMHYLDSAPDQSGRQAIVLLHGASSNLRDFAFSVFPALAQHYRVIAIDRPGHGYSARPSPAEGEEWVTPLAQARLVHGLLEKLSVRKPVMVGHSWAGAVVLALALEYPDDTGAVVMLAGASQPYRSDPAFHNRWPAIPVLGDIFVHSLIAPAFAFVAEQSVARNFAPNIPPADYASRAGLELLIRPENWRANAEDMRNLAGFLAVQKNRYRELRMPVTIISGEEDRSVSTDRHALRLHKQVAGSRLILLPETGHNPHHAHPDVVIKAILDIAREAETRD